MAETEMVERVARAIAEQYGQSPSFNWEKYKGAARAAIEAMRIPTAEMLRHPGHDAAMWEHMIDAALSPKE